MTGKLAGKRALVTGAASGIGKATAESYAREGAVVAVQARSIARAADTLASIAAEGGTAFAVAADLTDTAAIEAMCAEAIERLGGIDIIVNNAVHQYEWTSVLEQEEADYESQFQTCVLHNLLMVKAFVPDMIAKKSGRGIATNTECTRPRSPSQPASVSRQA